MYVSTLSCRRRKSTGRIPGHQTEARRTLKRNARELKQEDGMLEQLLVSLELSAKKRGTSLKKRKKRS